VAESKEALFARFQQYLRGGFVPHPVDITAAVRIRAFTKWYFDFVKNLLTVGALMAIGKKTHSVPVSGVAWLSFVVLGIYVVHHVHAWHFQPFHIFGNSRRALAAGLIFWSLFAGLITLGIQVAMFTAIDAIVNSSAK
jgi:hypothetical protein